MMVYHCGNCDDLITCPFKSNRPKRCSKCGWDIDWLGIYTRKIIICPNCGEQDFEPDDKFCDVCPEPVRLKQLEIEE
jgi:ribosomal protein L37E